MTETIERISVTREYLSVSKLIWNRFKKPMPGLLERVLQANPGLAAAGPFIPVGWVVALPIPEAKPVDDITPIRLWSQ